MQKIVGYWILVAGCRLQVAGYRFVNNRSFIINNKKISDQ